MVDGDKETVTIMGIMTEETGNKTTSAKKEPPPAGAFLLYLRSQKISDVQSGFYRHGWYFIKK